MPSEAEAAREVLDRLPQRRPASLYDVAVQYAVLDWYDTVTSGDLDFDLDPEHLAFMTPNAKEELYGEDDNAIVVKVDLSDPDNPRLADDPVEILTVEKSRRYELGHAYPEGKSSSMTDYSITTHKSADAHHLAGRRDDAWGTANVQDRFTRWAQSDAAARVVDRDDVEDAWVVEVLAELGDDEAAMERVESAFMDEAGGDEETEFEAFVTVRVKLPGDEDYRWPGQVAALNEVMVEQKADRLENVSVEDAAGEGVGYVSGEEGRVTGGSAGLLGMYGKKQREHFPDLSPSGSEAWRSRPLTRESAASIAAASSVFEAFYTSLGNNRRMYVFPYLASHPDALDPSDVETFAERGFNRLRDADDFEAAVEDLYNDVERATMDTGGTSAFPDTSGDDADVFEAVRFASAFVVTGNPPRVFFETTDVPRHRPQAVADAHRSLLTSGEFVGDGVFADTRAAADSWLLNATADLGANLLFGSYFTWTTEPTRTSREASETPKAGDVDDVRARRLRSFLTGERIGIDTLLDEYLNKLVQDQRRLLGEDKPGVPIFSIVEQYVQLRALHDADVLDERTTTIATVTDTDNNTTQDSAEEQLAAFIEGHDLLRQNDSYQAAFCLGGLVGRISAYQRENGISSTLVSRYPIDYLTKQSAASITKEVLEVNSTYTDAKDDFHALDTNHFARRLPNLMLDENPTEWSVRQNELQWVYALGTTYGNNDFYQTND